MINHERATMSANPETISFSAIETQPWDVLQRGQEVLLRQQLKYLVDHSDFYQAKMQAAGVDLASVLTLADLARVPFTYKQELRESLAAAPLLGLHRAAPMFEIVQIQASSGTTGSPAYVGLTRSDRAAWSEVTARGLFACGVRPHDLVLHAFSMSKGFVGGIPGHL